jgi:KDO2-lipid IV(A) lauroyltransferase
MERALYILAKSFVTFLQWLSLPGVVRLGRFGGGLFHLLDVRHRHIAAENIKASFPEKSDTEVKAVVKENFKRLGENFACAVKTASMTAEEIQEILTVSGHEKFLSKNTPLEKKSFVFAIGHFGNFELYARCFFAVPDYRFATTYRGLRQTSLNELLQSLRQQSGCLFFERRTDADALKTAMNQGNILLGLLADQHAGR